LDYETAKTYAYQNYESAKDYLPEINYTKFSLGLAAVLLVYHFYYRFSKFCFKRDFLMKFTQSQSLCGEFYARILAMTCCTLITLTFCFYHIPKIIPNLTQMETVFELKLEFFEKFMFYVLFGYIVHDLFWCMTHEWHDMLNYVHHAVSIWFCIATLIVNNAAFESVIGLTIAESSNVFLHLRWFIKFFRGKNSVFFDCLFAFMFFLTRILGGGWITYWLLKVDGPLTVRIMCFAMDVLNLGFSVQILGMIKRQLKKMRQEKQAVKNEDKKED